jgi:hypothetical protein
MTLLFNRVARDLAIGAGLGAALSLSVIVANTMVFNGRR